MVRARLKFRLHRTAIVLICLALLVILMQGSSYFSLSHQMARSEQVEELTRTLTRQVAFSLTPLLEGNDDNSQRIHDVLRNLTDRSRILDAGIYALDGTLISQAGEQIPLRDRLALDGNRAGSYFNHQLVEQINGKDGPIGFLRVTLDTHVLETEAKQVDNTTNILRLMILLALAIGIILARTLLQHRRSRWQQSPYLLTA
ncbi:YtjB family periplasmic protein, partial [Lonsdalea populi]